MIGFPRLGIIRFVKWWFPFLLIFVGANYLMERCEPYEIADDYYD